MVGGMEGSPTSSGVSVANWCFGRATEEQGEKGRACVRVAGRGTVFTFP